MPPRPAASMREIEKYLAKILLRDHVMLSPNFLLSPCYTVTKKKSNRCICGRKCKSVFNLPCVNVKLLTLMTPF